MKLTYIYVKQLPNGLLYLGKTEKNPYKYKGSGTDWLKIIKNGNYKIENIKTYILHETTDKLDLDYMGRYYSKLFNIVESPLWANKKIETGDGGGSKWTKDRKHSFINKISGDNHWTKKPEAKKILKDSWNDDRKKLYKKIFTGRKMPTSGIQKIKNSWTKERKEKHAKNNPANSEKALQKRKDSMLGSSNWRAKKVNQYTIDGDFVKQYSCIAEALKQFGKNIGISAACNGRAKTAGGYIWKYA